MRLSGATPEKVRPVFVTVVVTVALGPTSQSLAADPKPAVQPPPTVETVAALKQRRSVNKGCVEHAQLVSMDPLVTGQKDVDDIGDLISETTEELNQASRLVDISLNVMAGVSWNEARPTELEPARRNSFLLAPGAAARLNAFGQRYGIAKRARFARQAQRVGIICRDVVPALQEKYREAALKADASAQEDKKQLDDILAELSTLETEAPAPPSTAEGGGLELAAGGGRTEKLDVKLRREYLQKLAAELRHRLAERTADKSTAGVDAAEVQVLEANLARLQRRLEQASPLYLGFEVGLGYAVEAIRFDSKDKTTRTGVISTAAITIGYGPAQMSLGGFLGDGMKGLYLGTGMTIFD